MRRWTHTRLYSHASGEILRLGAASLGHRPARSIFLCRARASRSTPDLRHRQGRRRQVDRRHRARPARRAPRTAHDRRRAGQPGARPRRRFEHAGRDVRGGRAGRAAVHDLDRSPARDGGVPARQDRRRRAGAGLEPAVSGLRDGHAGHARAAEHRQGVGAGAVRAPHQRRRRLRPGDRRLAGRRPRGRRSCAPRGRSPRSPGSGRSPTRDGRSPPRSPTTSSPPWSPWPPPRRCRSTRRCGCATRWPTDELRARRRDRQRAATRERFTAAERRQAAAGPRQGGSPLAGAALGAALSEHARAGPSASSWGACATGSAMS